MYAAVTMLEGARLGSFHQLPSTPQVEQVKFQQKL